MVPRAGPEDHAVQNLLPEPGAVGQQAFRSEYSGDGTVATSKPTKVEPDADIQGFFVDSMPPGSAIPQTILPARGRQYRASWRAATATTRLDKTYPGKSTAEGPGARPPGRWRSLRSASWTVHRMHQRRADTKTEGRGVTDSLPRQHSVHHSPVTGGGGIATAVRSAEFISAKVRAQSL